MLCSLNACCYSHLAERRLEEISIFVRVDHAVHFDRCMKVNFVPTHSPSDSTSVIMPNESSSKQLQFSVFVTL